MEKIVYSLGNKLVTNLRTLKSLEKQGFISFDTDTPKYKYVNCGERSYFKAANGKSYEVRYISGCFLPFVYEIITVHKKRH